MNLKYLVILFSLCGTQLGAQEKPNEYYFGVLEKFSGKGDSLRIDVKILPTNRIRPFYKVSPTIVVSEHVGKRVRLVLSDSETGRYTHLHHGNYPDHEKALLPLAEYIVQQKMPLVAEEFLAWGMQYASSLRHAVNADPKFNGHLIAGRISCDEKFDLTKITSQVHAFEGGYFVSPVHEPGKNVGFCYSRHLSADVSVDDVDAVQVVKQIVLKQPSREELGGFKLHVKLEGGKLLGEDYRINCTPVAARNLLKSSAFETPVCDAATFSLAAAAKDVAAGELPPGNYYVDVSVGKPSTMLGHVRKGKSLQVESGKTADLGELVVPLKKLQWITLVASRTPKFDAKQVHAHYLFVGAGIGNIFVDKPEDVDDYKLWSHRDRFECPDFRGQLNDETILVQCGGVQLRPFYYVGPGPLSDHVDKDLKPKRLSPVNDAVFHAYQCHYETKVGHVYAYQRAADRWVLFQVDSKLPAPRPAEPKPAEPEPAAVPILGPVGARFPTPICEGFAETPGGSGRHSAEMMATPIIIYKPTEEKIREALKIPGAKFIMLKEGTIDLKEPLEIPPFTTITGGNSQTPGVTFTGKDIVVPPGSHDVVFSDIRLRKGCSFLIGAAPGQDATGEKPKRVIIDHVSIARGEKASIRIFGAQDITVCNTACVDELQNAQNLISPTAKIGSGPSHGILIADSERITIARSLISAFTTALAIKTPGVVEIVDCTIRNPGLGVNNVIAIVAGSSSDAHIRVDGNIFTRDGLRGKVTEIQAPLWIDPKLEGQVSVYGTQNFSYQFFPGRTEKVPTLSSGATPKVIVKGNGDRSWGAVTLLPASAGKYPELAPPRVEWSLYSTGANYADPVDQRERGIIKGWDRQKPRPIDSGFSNRKMLEFPYEHEPPTRKQMIAVSTQPGITQEEAIVSRFFGSPFTSGERKGYFRHRLFSDQPAAAVAPLPHVEDPMKVAPKPTMMD